MSPTNDQFPRPQTSNDSHKESSGTAPFPRKEIAVLLRGCDIDRAGEGRRGVCDRVRVMGLNCDWDLVGCVHTSSSFVDFI